MTTLTEDPPECLYHYTSPEAAISILKSGKIRLGHIGGLNDSTELDHGLLVLRNTLGDAGVFNELLPSVFEYLEGLRSISNIYVGSFTENRNQLSQWRAYANKPGGVSIGIRSEFIKQAIHLGAAFFGKCAYGGKSEGKLIDVFLAFVMSAESYSKDRTEAYEGVANLMMLFAPLLKNPAFVEESEWRIVQHEPSSSIKGPQTYYTSGLRGIVKYKEFNIISDSERANFPVKLTVGPCRNIDHQVNLYKSLLMDFGYTHPENEVLPCNIPYVS